MNRPVIIKILIMLISSPLFAGTPELLIEQANKAYINESYHEAIELYEQIAGMDAESDVLYYNLGNAYFKTGQYAAAILNYERALRLSPNNENIRHNLRIARGRLGDRSEPLPRLFFIEWHNSFIQIQSVDGWAVTSIILSFFLCFGIALFFLSRNNRQKKIIFSISLAMVIALITSLYAANRQYEKNYVMKEAIVMSPRVTAKSAPSDGAVDVFVIHEGRKLEITGELNGWYEVRLPDGSIGWIKKTAASVI